MSPGPYSSYKPSGVPWLGDVPEHWDVRRLKYLLLERDDRSSDGSEQLLRVSQYSGVTQRKQVDCGDGPDTRAESLVGYKCVGRDDLVVNIMLAWNGSMGVSQFRGITSPAYCVYRFFANAYPRFFHHLLRSQVYKTYIKTASTGVVDSRLRLYTDSLFGLYAPLPPLLEQHAIVRYLNHADRRIRRYVGAKRKLIALLEEERKIATLEAIQSPNAMARRLEVVADLVQRPIKRASDATYIPIGLYNRGRGMFRKEPRCGNDLGDSNFFWIEEGDLIISGQFAWEGAVALASDVEHGCVASHRYPILRGKPGILESGFLLGFFQTDWGKLLLDDNSRGAAGRNRPLNARALMKEKISLPPIETQLRIVGMLQFESHVRQQARLSEQLLKEYRTRLIADVVTGKLDVREAAALLPDNLEDEDPIDEDNSLEEETYEDSHDPDVAAEELAMESEVAG